MGLEAGIMNRIAENRSAFKSEFGSVFPTGPTEGIPLAVEDCCWGKRGGAAIPYKSPA